MPGEKFRFTSTGWRAPGLPGINEPLPPGAGGLKISYKSAEKLRRFLRTFDNTKTVAALAPYAKSAEELREAILQELAARGFEVGPSVAVIVSVGAMQRMWFEILNDRALAQDDPKLAESASRIGDAAKASILNAHELQHRIVKSSSEVVQSRDPLDAFDATPPALPAAPPADEPAT